jgi:hypothetical protein
MTANRPITRHRSAEHNAKIAASMRRLWRERRARRDPERNRELQRAKELTGRLAALMKDPW